MSVVLSSCDDDQTSYGEVDYYPSFLWTDAHLQPVTTMYDFDFSPDAKNDARCYAEFAFVDNDGKIIPPDVMQVFVDGKQAENNTFKVGSDVASKELKFAFSPNAKQGKHQGYFKLIHHNLDRLDSQPLIPGQTVDAFQWTLYFNKRMNPLAKMLTWLLLVVALILVLWFMCLRRFFYPHFGKFTKSILVKQDNKVVAQFNCSFKGARKVIFSTQKVKQSSWNKLFVGEKKTYVSPYFTSNLVFTPNKKNASAYGIGYSIRPNPIPKSGTAEIVNSQLKLTISIK
jgi:hypothetical protein